MYKFKTQKDFFKKSLTLQISKDENIDPTLKHEHEESKQDVEQMAEDSPSMKSGRSGRSGYSQLHHRDELYNKAKLDQMNSTVKDSVWRQMIEI